MAKKNKTNNETAIGIGSVSGCLGGNDYIRGKTVTIVKIYKNACLPGYDVDAPGACITDNESLELAGGIGAYDELEVETVGWRQTSTGCVRARELECCKDLRPKVKLVGTDGNAFNILGRVKKALEMAGMKQEAADFLEEATSGDYNKLLQTAEKYVDVE